MKFTKFLKVFGITLTSFVASVAAVVGVMAIFNLGPFKTANNVAEDISFVVIGGDISPIESDGSFVNAQGDFVCKIETTTTDIGKTDVELSLSGDPDDIVIKNNFVSNGIIIVPRYVEIGEEFNVSVVKLNYDPEIGTNQSWNVGGTCEISAKYLHSVTNATRDSLIVNIDVPVHHIEIECYDNSSFENNALSEFTIGTNVYVNVKFYPARSQFMFGNQEKNKNIYFVLGDVNNDVLIQDGLTNKFATNKFGNETINAYVFNSTIFEENKKIAYRDLDDATARTRLIQDLKERKGSSTANTEVVVTELVVGNIKANTNHFAFKQDNELILYYNKQGVLSSNNEYSLDIKLLTDDNNENASLQSKLNNVYIGFVLDDIDATESGIVSVLTNSKTKIIDDVTYFAPTGEMYEDYYCRVAFNKSVDISKRVSIVIKYIEENIDISTNVFASTSSIVGNQINYKSDAAQDYVLTIFDEKTISFEEFDLNDIVFIPTENSYKQVRFFAYYDIASSGNGNELTDYIDCKDAVSYTLNGQTFANLYEIEGGLLRAKSVLCHKVSINVLFMTVQADYAGNPRFDSDGKYIVEEYSKQKIENSEEYKIDFKNFRFEKTLKFVDASIEIENEISYNYDKNEEIFSFVAGTDNAFNILLTIDSGATQGASDVEKDIFEKAINDNKLSFVIVDENKNEIAHSYLEIGSPVKVDASNYIVKVDVNKFDVSTPDVLFDLYIKYQKTQTSVDLVSAVKDISLSAGGENKEFNDVEKLEVYSGSATDFWFNINSVDEDDDGVKDYVSSENNPIVVESVVEIESNNPVIKSSYKIGTDNVNNVLFEKDSNVINVVFLDKYGYTPINSNYSLLSSDPSIMYIAGDSENGYGCTFADKGSVELELLDFKGDVADILYFNSNKSVELAAVTTITEDGSYDKVINRLDDGLGESYMFEDVELELLGYMNTTITLKNSTNPKNANIINYYVDTKGDHIDSDLTLDEYLKKLTPLSDLIDFRILGDSNDYSDLFIYNGDSDLTYDEAFEAGLKTIKLTTNLSKDLSIRLEASISGFSKQIITITFRANAKTNLTHSSSSDAVSADDGDRSYIGVYDSTNHQINITIDLEKDVPETYKLYYLDDENNWQQITCNTSGELYIISQDDEDSFSESQSIDLVFNQQKSDNGSYKKYIISLKKERDYSIDVVNNIYVNVNPNVDVTAKVGSETIYYTNSYNVSNCLSFDYKDKTGIAGNFIIDVNEISIELETQKDLFKMEGNKISLKQDQVLKGVKEVAFNISYNGYFIKKIKLDISPDITTVDDSKHNNIKWQTYNGIDYLMLLGGKEYKFVDLRDFFMNTSLNNAGFVVSFDINNEDMCVINNDKNAINITETSKIDTEAVEITVTDAFYNSLSYKVMISPVMDFVRYEGLVENDLCNLLDKDYLIENEIYKNIEYSKDGQEIFIDFADETIYGINKDLVDETLFADSKITVEMIDGGTAPFATINDENKLVVNNIGKDQMYIIYIKINRYDETSMVVPYLINVQKSLVAQVYYPYENGNNLDYEIANTKNQMLASTEAVNYQMEYLTFNNQNSVSIDLNDVITTPNINGNQRINIGTMNANNFEETNGNIDFEITKVFYKTSISNFIQEYNFGYYANVDDGVLTISNLAECIRVEIKFSTSHLVEGYYYVSVGEQPNYTLTYADNVIGSSCDLEVDADSEIFMQDFNLFINEGNIEQDRRSDLRYKIYDEEKIGTDSLNGKLRIMPQTEDTTASFDVYTKYGILSVVNLDIKSNYKISVKDSENLEFDAGSSVSFSDLLNKFDVKDYNRVLSASITDVELIGVPTSVCLVENGSVYFSLVPQSQEIATKITFTSGSLTIEREFVFIVNPSIYAIAGNALNNQINLGNMQFDADINADNSKDIETSKLFNGDVASATNEKITFNYYREGVETSATSDTGLAQSITVPDLAFDQVLNYTCTVKFNGTEIFRVYFYYNYLTYFEVNANYPNYNIQEEQTSEYYYYDNSTSGNFDLTQSIDWTTASSYAGGEKLDRVSITVRDTSNPVTNSKFFYEINGEKYEIDSNVDFGNSIVYGELIQIKIFYGDNAQTCEYTNTSYFVTLCNDIDDIFNIATKNLIGTGTNSEDNRENIFFGTKDNVDNYIVVTFTVETCEDNGVIIFDNDILQQQVKITTNMVGKTYKQVIYMKDSPSADLLAYKAFASDSSITNDIILSNIDAESRFGVNYRNVNLDFETIYSIIAIKKDSNTAVNNGNVGYNIQLKLNGSNAVDSGVDYYTIESFDLKLWQEDEELTMVAGTYTNMLTYGDADQNIDPNFEYIDLFKLQKISNNSFYSDTEMKDCDLKFKSFAIFEDMSNDTLQAKSYIQIFSSTYNGDIKDYKIVVNGAPNNGIDLFLRFVIQDNEGNEKTFEVKVKVVDNYGDSLALVNNNRVNNTEVTPLELNGLQNVYLVSNLTTDNKVYISNKSSGENVAHKFKYVEISYAQNISDLFNVFKTNTTLTLTSKNETNLTFGTLNINVKFTDDYGFTFNYYISVKSQDNVSIPQGVTYLIYENDTVVLVDENTSQSGDSVCINVKMDAENSSFTASDYVYRFELFKDEKSVENFGKDTYDFKNSFKLPTLDIDWFDDIGYFTGTLKIQMAKKNAGNKFEAGNLVELFINVKIKQAYTIKQIDGDTYVRDGVMFSIYDAVEVIDNKNNVNLGETSLTDVVRLEISELKLNNNYLSGNGNYQFFVEYIDKNNKKSTKYLDITTDDVTSEIYFDITNGFNITSFNEQNKIKIGFVYNDETYHLKQYVGNSNEVASETINYNKQEQIVKASFNDESDTEQTISCSVKIYDDQLFTIVTPKIAGKEIDITFNVPEYFENTDTSKSNPLTTKTLCVNFENGGEQEFYLVEEGIVVRKCENYVNYITGKASLHSKVVDNGSSIVYKDCIVRGIKLADMPILKQVMITLHDDVNKLLYADNLEIKDNAELNSFYEPNLNKTIYYDNNSMSINVYPYDNSVQGDNTGFDDETKFYATGFELNFRVTSKFVGVENVNDRNIIEINVIVGTDYADNVLIKETNINLDVWAKQFILTTGYSTATSYSFADELLDFNNNIGATESGELKFEIVSFEGESNLAKINARDGIITLETGFELINNFIEVKVSVMAGNQSIEIAIIKLSFEDGNI